MNYKILLYIILLLFCGNLKANQKQIDSLKNLIQENIKESDYNKAITNIKELEKHTELDIKTKIKLANFYLLTSKFILSVKTHLEILEHSSSLTLKEKINTYHKITFICFLIYDSSNGSKYLKLSKKLIDFEDQDYQNQIANYAYLSNLNLKLEEKHQLAVDTLLFGLSKMKNETSFDQSILNSQIAISLLELKKSNQAQQYGKKALDIISNLKQKKSNHNNFYMTQLSAIEFMINNNQLDEAQSILDSIDREKPYIFKHLLLHHILLEQLIAEKKKDYITYFELDQQISQFVDTSLSVSHLNDILELFANKEIGNFNTLENEKITLIEKQNQVNRIQFYIWLTSITITILTLTLFTIRVIQKKRLVKLRINETKQSLKELNLMKQSKTEELSSYSSYLSSKNQYLVELKDEIKSLKKKHPKKTFEKLGSIINLHLNREAEHKEFQMYVEQINQDFFFKLENLNKRLTSEDKRLCVLLINELTSREISEIIHITTPSVEKRRYRLRQKLDLKKDQSLVEFLKNL